MRILVSSLALSLALLAPSAPIQAHESGLARLANRGERVPLIMLPTLSQRANESADGFVLRVGQWMLNYTTGTNYEVCGSLARTPDGLLSIRMSTNNSHIACGITYAVVADAVATGETIHSHPVNERFAINDADRAFIRDRATGGRVDRHARMIAGGADFSRWDYAIGAGYLVAHGKLLYQNGRGTSRVVAILEPAQSPSGE